MGVAYQLVPSHQILALPGSANVVPIEDVPHQLPEARVGVTTPVFMFQTSYQYPLYEEDAAGIFTVTALDELMGTTV